MDYTASKKLICNGIYTHGTDVYLEFIKFHLNHGTDTKNFHFCHGRTYFMQNIDGYFGTISKQLHEKMMEKLQKQFWYQMP